MSPLSDWVTLHKAQKWDVPEALALHATSIAGSTSFTWQKPWKTHFKDQAITQRPWLHQHSEESTAGRGTKSWGSAPARQWQGRSRATDSRWESCGLRAAWVPCSMIHPAVCHASSVPGTQAVFQKEWQTLKMNWSWQYGCIVSFSTLPPKAKSRWKRVEKNIKQHYKWRFHCLLQWLQWSCKQDHCFMWTDGTGQISACSHVATSAVGKLPHHVNWTYHEGHQRSHLDNSWQKLTQMFVLKLHKHFSCSTAAGSFCMDKKQKVLQSWVTAGAEASMLHGAATPCLDCKGSQKQLIKPGFRESAFSWSFWLTP